MPRGPLLDYNYTKFPSSSIHFFFNPFSIPKVLSPVQAFHLPNNRINKKTESLPSQSHSHSSFKGRNMANIMIKNMGFTLKTDLGSNPSSTSSSGAQIMNPRITAVSTSQLVVESDEHL